MQEKLFLNMRMERCSERNHFWSQSLNSSHLNAFSDIGYPWLNQNVDGWRIHPKKSHLPLFQVLLEQLFTAENLSWLSPRMRRVDFPTGWHGRQELVLNRKVWARCLGIAQWARRKGNALKAKPLCLLLPVLDVNLLLRKMLICAFAVSDFHHVIAKLSTLSSMKCAPIVLSCSLLCLHSSQQAVEGKTLIRGASEGGGEPLLREGGRQCLQPLFTHPPELKVRTNKISFFAFHYSLIDLCLVVWFLFWHWQDGLYHLRGMICVSWNVRLQWGRGQIVCERHLPYWEPGLAEKK